MRGEALTDLMGKSPIYIREQDCFQMFCSDACTLKIAKLGKISRFACHLKNNYYYD